MSIEDPRITTAWLAYYCGDNEMVESLIPDQEEVAERAKLQASIKEKKELEIFDFNDQELLFELADNYWDLAEAERTSEATVIESSNSLLRCTIWPLSEFRFEGRAYLTDVSVESESELSLHLNRNKLDRTKLQLDDSREVPLYNGSWRFDCDSFMAEVVSCDFGLFRINAVLKPEPVSLLSERSIDIERDMVKLLNDILPKKD